MPDFLTPLRRSTRASLLMLLALVLPVQGVVQLVAGLQGRHHVHPAAPRAAAAPAWLAPLRAVLDQLHTLPDPRLAATPGAWAQARSLALGEHRHGALVHRHSAQTADAQDLGESPDDGPQAGATVFLAWLPGALCLMGAPGHQAPGGLSPDWCDHCVAPPLAPPRA